MLLGSRRRCGQPDFASCSFHFASRGAIFQNERVIITTGHPSAEHLSPQTPDVIEDAGTVVREALPIQALPIQLVSMVKPC